MIKRNNKKGFTIVELVIVIAVIAILAAVLIPTFSGIIRKANISADTQLVKNMNTALAADEAINGKPDDFNDVIAIVRDAGYVLSAFNPTTEGCYVAWDKANNQLLLIDGKDDKFDVIYSVKDPSTSDNWYFAVDSEEAKQALKDHYGDTVKIEMAITTVKGLSDMLAAGGTQEIYIDESLVLDTENLLVFDKAGANTTINLGSAQLNTSGILSDVVPIQVKTGNVTINGGVIGAAGSYIDADGKLVNSPLETEEGTKIVIDGTTFNINASGYVTFFGEASISNAVFNGEGMGVYSGNNAQVVLENVTIDVADRCVWATNYNGSNHTDGTTVTTIKSGTYNGGSASFAPIAAYSGDIVIEGGTFTSNTGKFFYVGHALGSITIKGGTFGGKTLAELGKAGIEGLCQAAYTVTPNADGSFTITK